MSAHLHIVGVTISPITVTAEEMKAAQSPCLFLERILDMWRLQREREAEARAFFERPEFRR